MVPAFLEEVFGQRLHILEKCFPTGKGLSNQDIPPVKQVGHGMEEIGEQIQRHQKIRKVLFFVPEIMFQFTFIAPSPSPSGTALRYRQR